MRKLQQLIRDFLAREIGLEELQRRFAMLLQEDPGLSGTAAAWLDAGEREGRLSSTVCTSLRNVIVSHLAASAKGLDPRESGIFSTLRDPGPRTAERSAVRTSDAAAATEVRSQAANEGFAATEVDRAGRAPGTAGPELNVGAVVSARFVLVSRLGSGGMGAVFKARDRLREEAQDRNPFVALKVLSEDFKAHPDSMIALQREARRAQTLAHPNVITVHDFGRDGPHFYITMEYLEGSSLEELIRQRSTGPMPMAEAWPIIEGMGRALQYGHDKGIVHSDVKPGNAFVCDNGTVKVLDFGISRPMQLTGMPESDKTLFDPGKRIGGLTPAYAALEMWAQGTPDRRDDVYALACVAYLLLAGRHPYGGKPATNAYEEELVPPRIESLTRSQWNALVRGLAFHRKDRTPTVAKFLDELAPASVLRSRRRTALLAAVAVAAVAAVVGVRYYGSSIESRMLDGRGFLQGEAAEVPEERPVLTADQEQEIASWLQLAELYMSDITPQSSADEMAYVLSDGPRSVKRLYESVLQYDPWYEDALALRAQVVDLYSNKARNLVDAGDYQDAVGMVRRGMEIDPRSRTLYRLQETICDEEPELCGSR